jgi:hypothetical protein
MIRIWLRAWMRRQRATRRDRDLSTLWPSIRDQSPSLDRARRAFRLHCSIDPVWRDIEDAEIDRIISQLK